MAIITVKNSLRKKRRDLKDALGDDILRYIAELVTNSDDSYRRLESKNIATEDEKIIYIELQKDRRQGDSESESYIITVTDNAEGMTIDSLEKIFEVYGEDNAGGIELGARGIFGQGASDVLRSSAKERRTARIESIKNDRISKLTYNMDENLNASITTGGLNLSVNQLKQYRNNSKIFHNGTKISFGIPSTVKFNNKIKNNLPELISKYPSFRYLLNQENRKVIYVDRPNEPIILSSAEYQFKEETLLADKNFSMIFYDESIACNLKLYLNENKKTDGTNIIVRDEKFNVFDNTMFDYSNNAAAQKISGELLINGLYNICYNHLNSEENPNAIVRDNRTGFDSKNPFYDCLNKAISPIIEIVLNDISKNIQTTDITNNKKFNEALKELNNYLKTELKDIIHGGNLKGNTPPVEGIKFVRASATITKGKQYDLKLLINDSIISTNDIIQINYEKNDFIEVSPNAIKYLSEESENGLVTKSISVKASKVTSEPIVITASVDSRITTVAIEVVDIDIHYPEDGLEFYPNELVLAYDKPHTAKLYLDLDVIPIDSEIEIICEGLQTDNDTFIFKSCHLINNNIGLMNIVLKGGKVGSTYLIKSSYGDLSATGKITLIEPSKNDNPGGGMIAGFKLEPNELSHQAYYNPQTHMIMINNQNPINIRIMGDLKDKNPQNPTFTREQSKYLCDIISTQTANILVKEQIRKNDINYGDIEDDFEGAIEHTQKLIQEHKNKIYQLLFPVLIASSEI